MPVSWDAAAPGGYVAEYAAVGAIPGVLPDRLRSHEGLRRALGQCVLYSRRDRDRADAAPQARLLGALLVKLLQRGRAPWPTLGIERTALRVHGFEEQAEDLSERGQEMGWTAPDLGRDALPDELVAALSRRREFVLDADCGFDAGGQTSRLGLGSRVEERFLTEWVPAALGRSAGHWFMPQAPLERLVESLSGEPSAEDAAARGVDFLVCHPSGTAFVVELDGSEHESYWATDKERDGLLASCGLDVVRVPNEEVERGAGAGLERVRELYGQAAATDSAGKPEPLAAMLLDCAEAARVQMAVARAVAWCWLGNRGGGGGEWLIELRGGGDVAAAGVSDALTILEALEVLYGGRTLPPRCRVLDAYGAELTVWQPTDGLCEDPEHDDAGASHGHPPQRLVIASDQLAGPLHEVVDGDADFVIRPACLPVSLATDHAASIPRAPVRPSTSEEASPALRVILRHVFRKCEFREKQDLAVFNVLKERDSVVLLPTGAGKSLIYQMAGLLRPGTTLVVDPIIALMEDQVEGLGKYGMDRAADISSAVAEEDQTRLLARLERGEVHFLLLTPERMQSPRFRDTLAAMKRVSPVNLAVIDEAHCVSEWGHDFRPAYLSLAASLRRFSADREGSPPPVLALTGTASRAVLRDMLEAVGIDRERSDALIRPDSFDRRELKFEIERARPGQQEAALRGVLGALPADWTWPKADFFSAVGEQTKSGLVFVPHVNGPFGLRKAEEQVKRATGAGVASYAGREPKGFRGDWEKAKRRHATAFKANEIPVLVATKAFGMGIDKPNIRYTVHYGMPQSLENFYQEAGRAGRDQAPARCKVVFSEYDAERSDHLLDPNADLPELRRRYERVDGDWSTKDDIGNALFFHFNAFGDPAGDQAEVEAVLVALGDLSERREVRLPFGGGDRERKVREKALYRLVRLGVVHDYQVEFGRGQFIVDAARFDLDWHKAALLRYVEATQPARVPVLARRLEEVREGSRTACVLRLAAILIDFTFDVIERSRRRMIQESMLLARRADTDAEIRRRLLDYLSEGFGAERLEELLSERRVELAGWFDLFGKVQSPMEAGELRGLCIRFLESYPDHPALLLVRAAAEAMCTDADDSVSSGGIRTAIRAGVETYELPRSRIGQAIDWLVDLSDGAVPGLGQPAAVALLGLHDAPDLSWVAERVIEAAAGSENQGLRQQVALFRLERLLEQVEPAVDRTVARWTSPRGGKEGGSEWT